MRADPCLRIARLLPEPSLLLRGDGIVLYSNAAAERLTGRTGEELEGRKLATFVASPEDRISDFLGRCAQCPMMLGKTMIFRLPDGSELPCHCEGGLLRLRRKKGSSTFLLRCRPEEPHPDGKEPGAEAQAAALEARVRERTEQLVATNRELDAFTYTISHDLRSPLRSISGYAEILIAEFAERLPDKVQGYLNRMRCNAQKMGELIDDLLNFSRLSQHMLRREAIDLRELVLRVWEDELKLERQGRKIEFLLGELPTCLGDPALLRQVFFNLLSNALKFTRGRPLSVIEVSCRMRAGEPVYFVRDNGPGFAMKDAEKLFGVFERLHLDAKYEGTGVGLAIMQRIIHQHGGAIWAESEEGRGASFYFTIPREEKLT